MRVDGYVRVSRVGGREGEGFISPELQREQIEGWAKMRRATVAEWHTDLDMSGARADRPGLLAAIARVEAGQTQGIVVAKLDRLARSLPVALDAIGRIEAAGGQVVSVDEGIDPTTVNGRMLRSLLLVIAAWYREQTREAWAIARERAVRRGVQISSTVPTGYRRIKGGRLKSDPRWAPVVRDIFDRRAKGATWADLARRMNERGVPVQYASGRQRDAGRWTGATVSRLVAGRVYLGESRHGAFVNPDAHEPLVPAATWHAAQRGRGVQRPLADSDPALLSGLVRCSGCGYGMHRSKGRGPGGRKTTNYRCRGGGSGGRCPDRGFADAERLEALVVAEFLAHAERLTLQASGESDEMDTATAELAEAEEALRVFRDDPRIIAALGADGFAAGLAQRARRVEDAHRAVASARTPTAGVPDVVTLRGMWPNLPVYGRRRLLASAIDCVVVAGRGELTTERVRICWSGLEPDDVPRRGKRGSGMRPIPLDGLPDDTRPTLTGEVGKDK